MSISTLPSDMPKQLPVPPVEEFSILDLWYIMVAGKWVIFLCTLVMTAALYAYATLATPQYKVVVLINPVIGADDKKSMGTELSNMVSMVGFGTGSRENTRDVAIAKLTSRKFIENFIREEELLPVLYPKKWDAENKKWNVENIDQIPDIWDAVSLFRGKILNISDEKKTGILTVSILWKDREEAYRWAKILVEKINKHLRENAINDAEKNLEFLNLEYRNAVQINTKNAISRLTETQLNKIMMAKVKVDYGFEIVDPPAIPPKGRYESPKKKILVLGGFVGGLFLGIVIVLFRDYVRRHRKPIPTQL